MKGHEKAIFFVAILLIVGIIGLNYYVGEFYVSDDSGQVLQKRSGSLLTGAAIGVQEEVSLSSGLVLAEWKNCPQYTSEGQVHAGQLIVVGKQILVLGELFVVISFVLMQMAQIKLIVKLLIINLLELSVLGQIVQVKNYVIL